MEYDKHNMLGMISSLPKQISEMIDSMSTWNPTKEFGAIENIVICGMGGSAIAGDLLCNIVKDDVQLYYNIIQLYSINNLIYNINYLFKYSKSYII